MMLSDASERHPVRPLREHPKRSLRRDRVIKRGEEWGKGAQVRYEMPTRNCANNYEAVRAAPRLSRGASPSVYTNPPSFIYSA